MFGALDSHPLSVWAASVVGLVLVVGCGWYFIRSPRGKVVGFRDRMLAWRLRAAWPSMSRGLGFAVKLPSSDKVRWRLPRMKSLDSAPHGLTAVVRVPRGGTAASIVQAEDALRSWVGVNVRCAEESPGLVRIDFLTRDALAGTREVQL